MKTPSMSVLSSVTVSTVSGPCPDHVQRTRLGLLDTVPHILSMGTVSVSEDAVAPDGIRRWVPGLGETPTALKPPPTVIPFFHVHKTRKRGRVCAPPGAPQSVTSASPHRRVIAGKNAPGFGQTYPTKYH